MIPAATSVSLKAQQFSARTAAVDPSRRCTFVQFTLSAYPNGIRSICSLIAVSFHTTLANWLPRTRLRFEDPVEPFLLESIGN